MERVRRHGRAVRALAALAATVAVALPAGAQVNVEKMRVGAEEPGWGGALDVNTALQRGNTERDTLGGGIRIQYAWPRPQADGTEGSEPFAAESASSQEAQADEETEGPRSVVFLTSNYSFTRLNDKRFVNNALSHLRFIRRHSPRVSFEAFGQHQFNEFIRLGQRLLLGGGGRFALLQANRTEVFFGAGYMMERETLDLPAALPDLRRNEHHRSTNYVTVRYNSEDERLRLVQTVYVQARLDRLQDLRLLSDTSFEIQLMQRLALAINLNVTHDSEPPTGVKETDIVLSNSLRYSF